MPFLHRMPSVPAWISLLVACWGLGPGARAEESQDRPTTRAQLGTAPRLSTDEISVGAESEPRALEASLSHRSANSPLLIDDFSFDTQDRWESLLAYHRHYRVPPASVRAPDWTGDLSKCDPGSIASGFHDLVRRRINYFRAQAGLSSRITFSSAKNEAAQAAAMLMAAQRQLSHHPLQDFPENPCVTTEIDLAAASSNLALGSYGLDSIDRFMLDDGAHNGAAGHRRWLLYSRAQVMGHGSIPPGTSPQEASAAAVWVIGDFAPSGPPRAITWPNAGYCPYSMAPGQDPAHQYPRWSFGYPAADFSSATLSMTLNGQSIATTLEPLQDRVGDNSLVWRLDSLALHHAPAAGSDHLAEIHIQGIRNAPFSEHRYQVRLFDPFDLQQELSIEGPARPTMNTLAEYTFSQLSGVDAYLFRLTRETETPWHEGAESDATVTDGTDDRYALRDTSLASSGQRSFHLLFPKHGLQWFSPKRTVVPSKSARLKFQRLFRFFYPHSKLVVSLTDDDGSNWEPVFEVSGHNASGSSSEWDSDWSPVDIALPERWHGKPIRMRFHIETGGAFYQWSPGQPSHHYGVFIDDITLAGSITLSTVEERLLDAHASGFQLNPEEIANPLQAGQRYGLQVAPIINEQTFAFSPAFTIEPQDGPGSVNEKASWHWTHFSTSDVSGTRAPQADFDSDGISNLLERGLGTNPTRTDGGDGARCLPSGWATGSEVGIAFSLPNNPHQDLVYEVQASSDLVSWETFARKTGTSPWQKVRQEALIETAPDPDKNKTSVRLALSLSEVMAPQQQDNNAINLRLQITEIP